MRAVGRSKLSTRSLVGWRANGGKNSLRNSAENYLVLREMACVIQMRAQIVQIISSIYLLMRNSSADPARQATTIKSNKCRSPKLIITLARPCLAQITWLIIHFPNDYLISVFLSLLQVSVDPTAAEMVVLISSHIAEVKIRQPHCCRLIGHRLRYRMKKKCSSSFRSFFSRLLCSRW